MPSQQVKLHSSFRVLLPAGALDIRQRARDDIASRADIEALTEDTRCDDGGVPNTRRQPRELSLFVRG